jgi:hypothetical protein
VVIDDVEDDAEPVGVRLVDELRELSGPAVDGVRRVGVDPVVAPVAVAGEGRDRHQLDRRDAELFQVVQARHDAGERALAAERADVELVHDEALEADAVPGIVGPAEARGIDDARRPANALRLEPRARIRKLVSAVEEVRVIGAGCGRQPGHEHPFLFPGGAELARLSGEPDGNVSRMRRPDGELDQPVAARDGS